MPSSRFNRLSLIIASLALALLATPLVNIIIKQGSGSAIVRTGTGLFLFWLLLIGLTVIANRFHRRMPTVTVTAQSDKTNLS